MSLTKSIDYWIRPIGNARFFNWIENRIFIVLLKGLLLVKTRGNYLNNIIIDVRIDSIELIYGL